MVHLQNLNEILHKLTHFDNGVKAYIETSYLEVFILCVTGLFCYATRFIDDNGYKSGVEKTDGY